MVVAIEEHTRIYRVPVWVLERSGRMHSQREPAIQLSCKPLEVILALRDTYGKDDLYIESAHARISLPANNTDLDYNIEIKTSNQMRLDNLIHVVTPLLSSENSSFYVRMGIDANVAKTFKNVHPELLEKVRKLKTLNLTLDYSRDADCIQPKEFPKGFFLRPDTPHIYNDPTVNVLRNINLDVTHHAQFLWYDEMSEFVKTNKFGTK